MRGDCSSTEGRPRGVRPRALRRGSGRTGGVLSDRLERADALWIDARLTELIWKDAVEAAGVVGHLDADPLYDSQDTDGLTNLKVQTVTRKSDTARVLVTYDDFKHTYTIDDRLERGKSGWRITNIHRPRWKGDLVTTLSVEW